MDEGTDSVWVAVLHVSPAVAAKISSKHGMDVATVRSALIGRDDFEARWDDDPRHGGRVIILASDERGRAFLAWLQPMPQTDVWALRTARYV